MEMLHEILWKMGWQTAILAAVVWVIARFAKTAPAAWRHALWLVVLIKFFVPPFAYLPSQMAVGKTPPPSTYAKVVTAEPPVPDPKSERPDAESAPTTVKDTVRTVATIAYWNAEVLICWTWLAVVSIGVLVLLVRYRRQKWLVAFAPQAGEEYDAMLAECAEIMSVRRLPGIKLSHRVSTPMLTGLRRPTILLPAEITESCSRSDLRAMLMHELAHVRRRDMAVIWLQQLAQILFFFHPAVWITGHELKREREIACDEMVLSKPGIPQKDYASGYVAALRLASDAPRSTVSLAMAEPFEVERRRVHLMLRTVMPKFTLRWAIALAVVLLVGIPTFTGCRRSAEARTKVTDDGFALVYKDPPTWKWNGLTFTVKSVGRSKYADQAQYSNGDVSKGMLLDCEFRGPDDRWSCIPDADFALTASSGQRLKILYSLYEARRNNTELIKLDSALPSRSTRSVTLRGRAVERSPERDITGGPFAVDDMKRPVRFNGRGLTIVTTDWEIGGTPYTYIQDLGSEDSCILSPMPEDLRSVPADARYLTMKVIRVTTSRPDWAYPHDFVVYDSKGRSVRCAELDGVHTPFSAASGGWGGSPHAYLGMQIAPVAGRTDENTDLPNLLVVAVDPNGPACKAGVKTGDIVVKGITWKEGWLDYDTSMEPIRLELWRGGRTLDIELNPAPDPLWSLTSTEARNALRSLFRECRHEGSADLSQMFVYSLEPLPPDFEPAKVSLKMRTGGSTVREVKFRIDNIPIPDGFWEQMDKQKPALPSWKRGG